MVDILIRPLQLRQIASQLRTSAKKIDVSLQTIDNDILSLKGNIFLGNRASSLQSDYQSKRDSLRHAREFVLQFADDLQNTANIFEQADRIGEASPSLGLSLLGLPFGSSFWPAYWNFYEVDKNFLDIMKTFMGGRGNFKEALRLLGIDGAYSFFKNGVPYQDAFDSVFRKLNKPFGPVFGAGIAIGTLEDVIKGTYQSVGKALAVNTVDGLVTDGLMFIPHVRAALLVSGAVQIAGNATLGIERVANDFIAADDVTRAILLDQSEIKATSLEKMDLGNITKSFSESVCDGFLFTDNGRNGLVKTAKSTVNVLDGAVEFVDNSIVSSGSSAIAFTDRAIQSSFLSDEIKEASTTVSHEVLADIRDYMNDISNVFEWR